jgi:DNA-binding CsgD family transcriptional regulator
VPTDLRSTLRDLALGFAAQIIAAARQASLAELFEADANGQTLAERVSRGAAAWGATYELSDAEVDVLRSAALGESRTEIARRRGTSVQTVATQAARLLRRTRDGSLERAANRLLREVVQPAPRAVTTARFEAGEGGGRLEARIDQLRRLAEQPPDDSVRYAIGAIIKELKSHPESYGESAVSAAAAAIGEDLAGLYRFASVAERWSGTEVRALLSDGTLSWSHLVALARIESRAVRERFLRRVQREGLSIRKLVKVLEAAGVA